MAYPTSLDDLTNMVATNTLGAEGHNARHTELNTAVESLEAKVGVDSSAVVTSIDYKLSQKAAIGANSDITSITGLTTPLAVNQGGSGKAAVTANSYLKGAGTSALVERTYTEVKTDLSLDNVENTALSTWAGTSDITTLGTVTTGNVDAVVTFGANYHIFDSDVAITTGDGKVGVLIRAEHNGFNISDAIVGVYDKGITGTTDIQIRRRRAGSDVDVLSTKITLGDEFFASDGDIDTANDDLATGDIIFIDVDAIHSGTAPNGLDVGLSFTKP